MVVIVLQFTIFPFVSPSDHKVSDIVCPISNQIILLSLHLTTKRLILLAPFQTKLSFCLFTWPQNVWYCWPHFKPNYHFVSSPDHKTSDIVDPISNQIIISSLHLTTKPLLFFVPFQTKLSFFSLSDHKVSDIVGLIANQIMKFQSSKKTTNLKDLISHLSFDPGCHFKSYTSVNITKIICNYDI